MNIKKNIYKAIACALMVTMISSGTFGNGMIVTAYTLVDNSSGFSYGVSFVDKLQDTISEFDIVCHGYIVA